MKTKDLQRLKDLIYATSSSITNKWAEAERHELNTIVQNEIVRKHQKKVNGGFWVNRDKINGLNKIIDSKDLRIRTLEKENRELRERFTLDITLLEAKNKELNKQLESKEAIIKGLEEEIKHTVKC